MPPSPPLPGAVGPLLSLTREKVTKERAQGVSAGSRRPQDGPRSQDGLPLRTPGRSRALPWSAGGNTRLSLLTNGYPFDFRPTPGLRDPCTETGRLSFPRLRDPFLRPGATTGGGGLGRLAGG